MHRCAMRRRADLTDAGSETDRQIARSGMWRRRVRRSPSSNVLTLTYEHKCTL